MSDPLGLIPSLTAGRVGPAQPPGAKPGPDQAAGTQNTFKNELLNQLKEVNTLQQEADDAVRDLAAGKRDDIEAVMNATRKAELAFDALLQVRNKVMDAYKELKQVRV